MKTEIVGGHEISTDGRTVWINSGVTGMAIGRFGVNAIDIHTHDAGACLDCSVGSGGSDLLPETTILDWHKFKRGVRHHFGIEVPDSFLPSRLRLQIGVLLLEVSE